MPVVVEPPAEPSEPKPARTRKSREITYDPYRAGVKLGGRTVSLGSVGDDVKRLQSMLNKVLRRTTGFEPLVVDAIFGPKTEAAVKRYQRSVSIKGSGVVDRDTWASLGW